MQEDSLIAKFFVIACFGKKFELSWLKSANERLTFFKYSFPFLVSMGSQSFPRLKTNEIGVPFFLFWMEKQFLW